MRSKSAEKVKLSSFDDLFGKEEPVSGEVVTSVPIDLLLQLFPKPSNI